MEETVVDVDAMVIAMEMNMRDETAKDEAALEATPYTIYKVLDHILGSDNVYVPKKVSTDPFVLSVYVPQKVSIGPFHWDKESLQPMEKIKWSFLRDLISRDPKNTLDNYITNVSCMVTETRKCYKQSTGRDDEKFIKMLVLDGCFIIELFLKFYLWEDRYAGIWDQLTLVWNDLLLLENQIPFSVLQRLFDLSVIPGLTDPRGGKVDNDTLKVLALLHFTGDARPDVSSMQEVYHLLHLVHSFHCQAPKDKDMKLSWWSVPLMPLKLFMYVIYALSYILILLVLLLLRGYQPGLHKMADSPLLHRRRPQKPGAPRIRSATELLEAGVKFRRKEAAGILNITFRHGTMEIPRLSLQEATISGFLNLLAFEHARPDSGSGIRAYLTLMDNLVDTAEDVALLVRCGILESKLGNDEEVALFFNTIGRSVSQETKDHYLVQLLKQVEDYCKITRHRHWATLEREYLSSPWALISLLAAFVLLLLTILSTFFSVYAYFRPPS